MNDARDTIAIVAKYKALTGLTPGAWLQQIAGFSYNLGSFKPLGKSHFAAFAEAGNEVLLVSFETMEGIRELSEIAQPLGWDTVRSYGWSSLTLVSDGDTWFRNRRIWGYFDTLIDDGFFDAYDTVIFYGAGSCGYAAAAYSVAAPGARVVAIQPQATLDPRLAGWDDRHAKHRRLDFTSRYGYAPDMLDACEAAFVLYDPRERLDAMHASLFHRAHAKLLPMPNMGDRLDRELREMNLLIPLLARAASDTLTPLRFARMARDRRKHRPYHRRLLARLEAENRLGLVARLCRFVVANGNAPKFAKRLRSLESQAAETAEANEG